MELLKHRVILFMLAIITIPALAQTNQAILESAFSKSYDHEKKGDFRHQWKC